VTPARSIVDRSGPQPTIITRGQAGPKGATGADGAGGGGIAPINFSYGDASPKIMHTLPNDGTVIDCSILVDTIFNGLSSSLTLGIAGTPALFIPASNSDPTTVGQYDAHPNIFLTAGTQIVLAIVPGGGASQGTGRVLLTILES